MELIKELKFERVLGKGGMGMVWLATHSELGQVAAKFLNVPPDRAAKVATQLRNEVRASARMYHPGIVNTISSGVLPSILAAPLSLSPDSPFILMEYVDGLEFSQAFPKPTMRFWDSIFQLLDALGHIHARGVVHRDLKPSNIMVMDDYTTKLLDMGVAHVVEKERMLVTAVVVSGTPRYMAPEQILGQTRDQGPWTDLYSFACLLFKALTGQSPYDHADKMQLLDKHLYAPIPNLPDGYPTELNLWFQRSLAKAPGDRFQFASHAAKALREILLPPVSIGGDLGDATQTLLLDDGTTQTWDAPREFRVDVPSRRSLKSGQLADWRTLDTTSQGMVWTPELFSIREFPLVGMEDERDAIWGEFHQVYQGDCRVVYIAGIEGSGPSALTQWLTICAHELGAALSLEVEYNSPTRPNDGIGYGLKHLFQCSGLSFERRALRLCTHPLLVGTSLNPVDLFILARNLAQLTADPDEVATEVLAPAAGIRVITKTLELITQSQPLIIRVTNPGSSSFFNASLQSIRNSSARVLIILSGESDLKDVDLMLKADNLDTQGAQEVVALEFGLSSAVAHQLATLGDGNRFLMRQILDDWVDRRLLKPGAAGVTFEGDIPIGHKDVWIQRFSRAVQNKEASWSAAYVLAILGSQFSLHEFEYTCELLNLRNPLSTLELMKDMSLLTSDSTRLRWSHDRIHESFLAKAKASLHASTITEACIKSLGESPSYQSRLRAGTLLNQAGENERALSLLISMGRAHDVQLRILREVLTEIQTIMDPMENPPAEAKAWSLVWASRLASSAGRSQEASELAAESLLLTRRLGGEPLAENLLYSAAAHQMDFPELALTQYQEALTHTENASLKMTIRVQYMWGLIHAGRQPEAASYLHAHAAEAEKFFLDNPIVEARWKKLSAYLLTIAGQFQEAKVCIQEALKAAETLNSDGIRISLLTSLAETLQEEGAFDEAIKHLLEAKKLSVFTGDHQVSFIRTHLSIIYIQTGRWKDAELILPEIHRDYEDLNPLIEFIRFLVQAKDGTPEPLARVLATSRPAGIFEHDMMSLLRCLAPSVEGELFAQISEILDGYSATFTYM